MVGERTYPSHGHKESKPTGHEAARSIQSIQTAEMAESGSFLKRWDTQGALRLPWTSNQYHQHPLSSFFHTPAS
ncbi:hypothetical protein SAMN04488112_10661 [Melghirimyces thermohalophilus]|uniref:Uncharacterized protein n=1 Tax=Melghirimyces thermohalophilus TaxID=1236220 RepID=A0A1G6KMY8_9BACL|nr:hypothetical protein SAMN04488112_10661 [Melghirimyces thermohalophilus]